MSRQKELDADLKAIQEVEFVEQLNNTDSVNADGTESMFFSTILERIKEMRLNYFQGSIITL